MCQATELRLVEGGTYRIQIDMDEGVDGEWFDKNRRTDVAGFAADSVRHVMASPLKRWWWENWFRPVARIGKRGNYEHVLRPAAPLTAMEHLTAMEVKNVRPNPQRKSGKRTYRHLPMRTSKAGNLHVKPQITSSRTVRSFPTSQRTRSESFLFMSTTPCWRFPV